MQLREEKSAGFQEALGILNAYALNTTKLRGELFKRCSPQYAGILAQSVVLLHKAKIYNPENRELLFQRPEYAVYTALKLIQAKDEHGKITQEYRDWLSKHLKSESPLGNHFISYAQGLQQLHDQKEKISLMLYKEIQEKLFAHPKPEQAPDIVNGLRLFIQYGILPENWELAFQYPSRIDLKLVSNNAPANLKDILADSTYEDRKYRERLCVEEKEQDNLNEQAQEIAEKYHLDAAQKKFFLKIPMFFGSVATSGAMLDWVLFY